MEWKQHFIKRGFSALEDMLGMGTEPRKFCHGDSPTIADCCLVPQACSHSVENAAHLSCSATQF